MTRTSPTTASPAETPEEAHAAQLRNLPQEIAEITAQAPSAVVALERALERICRAIGWPVGHVYLAESERSGALIAAPIWQMDEPQRFMALRAATQATRFEPGTGRVGQVMVSGKPLWIPDITHDAHFSRARDVSDLGVRGYLAFPIISKARVEGVLEFFTDQVAKPTSLMLDVMSQIGRLLGHTVERERSATLVSRLQSLLTFSNELLGTPSIESALQRAIHHAIEVTPGVRRALIYLYDETRRRLTLRASTGFQLLPNVSLTPGEGLIGRCFSERREVVLNHHAELATALTATEMQMLGLEGLPGSLIIMPLVAHNQAIGVLLLIGDDGRAARGEDVRATVEGLASLLSTAMVANRGDANGNSGITRLSATDAGVLQAARLAAVGELATSIAHEVNNPLYAARTALQLLADDLAYTRVASPYLSIARDELARIAGIMQRIREFARPTPGQFLLQDLNLLVEETIQLAAPAEREPPITTIFDPDHHLHQIRCDGTQIKQAMLNLILNAIDAMPHGGVLRVQTAEQGQAAVVTISDTGPGIADDIRDHLFEPFFTTKPGGTGLGLATAAHIAEQHGGRIEFESNSQRGSMFSLILPFQPNRAGQVQSP